MIHCLFFTHHRFTVIHPFNNGNGRTARLLTGLIAKMNSYENINLYVRNGGKARAKYKAGLIAADPYDDTLLKAMIQEGLLHLECPFRFSLFFFFNLVIQLLNPFFRHSLPGAWSPFNRGSIAPFCDPCDLLEFVNNDFWICGNEHSVLPKKVALKNPNFSL
jgi:hypothetical protein